MERPFILISLVSFAAGMRSSRLRTPSRDLYCGSMSVELFLCWSASPTAHLIWKHSSTGIKYANGRRFCDRSPNSTITHECGGARTIQDLVFYDAPPRHMGINATLCEHRC